MVSSSTFTPKKKRYILSIASFIFLILLTFFVFTKRSLDPTLSLYKDLYSQSQSPLLSSSSPQLSDSHSHGFSTSVQTNISLDNGDDDAQSPNSNAKSDAFSTSSADDSVDTESGTDFGLRTSVQTNTSLDNGDDDAQIPNSDANAAAFSTSTADDPDDTQNGTDFSSGTEDDGKKNAISDSGSASENDSSSEVVGLEKLKGCNMYNGKWVRDEENYPIYKPGECPYVDEAYDCQSNGRKDTNYLQWRWQPHDCDLPRFNAREFLKRLRGKRLMLVGDSMNRNQFESLLCLLHQGLPNKTKMYEVHGYKITKGRGYYIFKFEDYDCTVEFVRSHFLVKEGTRLGGTGNTNPTLSIDKIDKSSNRWKRADILVFNTGHWWTHGKTARGKNYYKEGDYIYPHFDAVEAYRRALKTWSNWIDQNIDSSKLVFYRGYSSAHFRGGDWDSGGTCNGETEPIESGGFLDNYPLKMKIVDEIIRKMRVPVVALNVTKLTNFRKDGHPSVYGKNVSVIVTKLSTKRQDCSHWCLPGVPDAWNELIYSTLLIRIHPS